MRIALGGASRHAGSALTLVAIGTSILWAGVAFCREIVASVGGHQMPWDPGTNADLAFGVSDGMPPRYIFGLDLHPGSLIRIDGSGAVTVLYADTPPSSAFGRGFRTADQPTEREGGPSTGTLFGSPNGSGLLPPIAPPEIGGTSAPSINPNAPHATSGTWGPGGQDYQIADGRTGYHGSRFPSYYMDEKHYPIRVNELVGAFVDPDGAVLEKPFPIGRSVTLKVPDGAAAVTLGLNSETFAVNRGGFTALITTKVSKVTVGPAAAQ